MKKLKIKKILFVITALTLSACGKDDSGQFATESKHDSGSIGHIQSGSACYSVGCYTTTSMATVQDRDYAYPNPENFSNVGMRPQYIAPSNILDLSRINVESPISKNFIFKEFMSPQKGRYGLFSTAVVSKLQAIRNSTGRPMRVTSGYRSPGYNKRTDGSATWSRHVYGDGVDFSIPGIAIKNLPALCNRQSASFTLTYSTHVHCDWRKANLDPAFYHDDSSKKLSPEMFISTAQLIAEQSQILSVANDSTVQFYADVLLDEEEEGDPTYEWTVTTPSQQILELDSPVIEVPREVGEFKLHVVIGGSIVLDGNFRW